MEWWSAFNSRNAQRNNNVKLREKTNYLLSCSWNEHYLSVIKISWWRSKTPGIITPFADIKSSVVSQKGKSQNGCFKKSKHAKFSKKEKFLSPWCVSGGKRLLVFFLIFGVLCFFKTSFCLITESLLNFFAIFTNTLLFHILFDLVSKNYIHLLLSWNKHWEQYLQHI